MAARRPEGIEMSHILHVSAGSVKESEDGNIQTITLGAVSINPSELIPLVGEHVILQTPGQKGRQFAGRLTLLSIKDGKHGPEVQLKVVGATELNGLVGTNVTVEAAQLELPTGVVGTYGESFIKHAVEKMTEEIRTARRGKGPLGPLPPGVDKMLDEAAKPIGEALAKPILEGDGKPNAYSGVVDAVKAGADDLENF
jgi:hypothetical protein